MNKCVGCGTVLQENDIEKEGYIKNLENNLCERCFRIKNYNEYKIVSKSNDEFIKIIKQIGETNDLVLLVVDLFNIHKELDQLKEYLKNDIILVLTKRDLLPESLYDEKLLHYLDDIDFVDKIIISSKKNYHFDELMDLIYKYKKTNNVYVVGFTNSGKSTMINKIIYNYSNLNQEITTSILPSTTLNMIYIPFKDDFTLIDTPGLLDKGNIIDYVDYNLLKKIIPKKEIKPVNYQIKAKQFFVIEDILRLDVDLNNDIVFYFSSELKINRYYKDTNHLKNLKKHIFNIKETSDIVINGLGFIKIMKPCQITLYTLEGVFVCTRKNLI